MTHSSFAVAKVGNGGKNETPFRLPASYPCESYRGRLSEYSAASAVDPTPPERETSMFCRLHWPSKRQLAKMARRFLEPHVGFRSLNGATPNALHLDR